MARPGDLARRREGDEPDEAPRNVPIGMVLFVVATAIWGGAYFALYAGDGGTNFGDQRTMAALAPPSADDVDGGALFTARCAACHQATGAGVPGAFPPLDESSWVTGDPRRPAAIALYGLEGAIRVKGADYASAMPAQKLADVEIAAVLSHVRSSWSNQADPVPTSVVTEVREALGERGPIQGASELESLFP